MISLFLVLVLMGIFRVPLPLFILWVAALTGATPQVALHSDLPTALLQVAEHWQQVIFAV